MKILVVDDERLTRRLLHRSLTRSGHEVVEAEDGAEALRILADQHIRFIITDWMMPNLNGLQLIERLRADNGERLVYIILLTAKEQKAELVEAMNAGADDFIRKPFDQDELAVRVRAGARILALTERLERQAMTDPLTGLLNRRGLEQAVADQGLGQAGLGFVVADLDHFKQVNDRWGHACGDQVLKRAAAMLRELCEPRGLVARVGGEEFWMLLRDCDRSELERCVERARGVIERTPVASCNGALIHLTGSFGCTHVGNLAGRGLEELFRVADAALYRAKRAGRNRVSLAEL